VTGFDLAFSASEVDKRAVGLGHLEIAKHLDLVGNFQRSA
jgi:hypothetical protein